MKYYALFILLVCLISCQPKEVALEYPVKEIDQNLITTELDQDIQELGEKIRHIDDNSESILQKLDDAESTKFTNRLEELKQNYAKMIGMVKKDYTLAEKQELKTQYIETKEIWDYLLKNYSI